MTVQKYEPVRVHHSYLHLSGDKCTGSAKFFTLGGPATTSGFDVQLTEEESAEVAAIVERVKTRGIQQTIDAMEAVKVQAKIDAILPQAVQATVEKLELDVPDGVVTAAFDDEIPF